MTKAPKKTKADKTAPAVTAADIEAEMGDVQTSSPEDLRAVAAMVREVVTLQQRIERGEELLKSLKSELNALSMTNLPDLMARAGTSIYALDASSGDLAGWKVEVIPMIAGSLPTVTSRDDTDEKVANKKAMRERGLNWIRKVGLGDIIETELIVRFDIGQDNLMGDLKGYAEKLGLAPDIESGVHHSRLCGAIKEYVKTPDPEHPSPPFEDLGLFAGRVAKLAAPKKGKK